MIRQFRPGVWVDPESVASVHVVNGTVAVHQLFGTSLTFLAVVEGDSATALADEIGEAARVAQEVRKANCLGKAFGPSTGYYDEGHHE